MLALGCGQGLPWVPETRTIAIADPSAVGGSRENKPCPACLFCCLNLSPLGQADLTGNEPMIHLFYCSNSMTESEARQLAARFGSDEFKMLSLPCSGKITIPYLVKAFESGADGVVLCCCAPAECRNLEGNLRASKRAQAVDSAHGRGRARQEPCPDHHQRPGGHRAGHREHHAFSNGASGRTGNQPNHRFHKESTSGARTRRETAA